MQSLQILCPVAAIIGLSMIAMASAPIAKPFNFTSFISEIFSSRGQRHRLSAFFFNRTYKLAHASHVKNDPLRQKWPPFHFHEIFHSNAPRSLASANSHANPHTITSVLIKRIRISNFPTFLFTIEHAARGLVKSRHLCANTLFLLSGLL